MSMLAKRSDLPPLIKSLLEESEEMIKIITSSRDKPNIGERLSILLMPRIHAIGLTVNKLLEGQPTDPSLLYEVLFEVILTIKESINLLPTDSLLQDVERTLFSLSMFIINTQIYFIESNDINRLNSIALILSELLISKDLMIQTRETFRTIDYEFQTKEFSQLYHFCMAIIALITNALKHIPVLSKNDYVLWTQNALSFGVVFLEQVEKVNFRQIARIDDDKTRTIVFPSKLYGTIYNYSSVLLNYSSLVFSVYQQYLQNEGILSNYDYYSSGDPLNKLLDYFDRVIKVVSGWIDETLQAFKNRMIGINDSPTESMDFKLSHIALAYIVFNKSYAENIVKYFAEYKKKEEEEGRKEENKIEFLEKMLCDGDKFFKVVESVFPSIEHIINSPYYSSYSVILEKYIAVSLLLEKETKDVNILKELESRLKTVFDKVSVHKDVKLFVNYIFIKTKIAYFENNLVEIEGLLESLQISTGVIDENNFYDVFSLKMFLLFNRIYFGNIELDELESELHFLSLTIIEPYLQHLREIFTLDTQLLLNLKSNNLAEIELKRNINPLDVCSWFYSLYTYLDEEKFPKAVAQLKMYMSINDRVNWASEE